MAVGWLKHGIAAAVARLRGDHAEGDTALPTPGSVDAKLSQQGSDGLVPPASWSVLITDMFHYQEEEEEYTYRGFPTEALAIEFARRHTRDSLEHLREPHLSPEEVKRAWYDFGEDAIVSGGVYAGGHDIDFFVAHPATSEERDWGAILREAGITSSS